MAIIVISMAIIVISMAIIVISMAIIVIIIDRRHCGRFCLQLAGVVEQGEQKRRPDPAAEDRAEQLGREAAHQLHTLTNKPRR